jgi:hypothetical protein
MRRRALLLFLASSLALGPGCAGKRGSSASNHPSRFEVARAELISSLRPASAITLPPLPADCIPASAGSQPQIGAYATFSGTATINSPYGPVANTTLSGSICGIATVINRPPNLCTSPPGQYASVQLHIPADGERITIPAVNVTLIPNLSIPITHISVIPTPITAIVCGVAAPGPIKQTVTASLPAATNTFGARCVLTATVPVAAEIYGPLGSFTITATNLPFTIPPLLPSPTCPSNVTGVANKLLALPLAQPANEIHITGTGLAYQP